MSALRQFGALLWKNVIVRKRSPMILVLEVLWPIIIFVGAVLMRSGSPPTEHETCSYPERSFPSAGMVPFLQSSVCTINNNCKSSQHIQERQTAQAKLQSLMVDLGPLLQKDTTLDAIRALPTVDVIVKGITSITDSTDMDQLNDKLKMSNLFRQPETVITVLTTKYDVLTDQAAHALMNSTLNAVQLLGIGDVVDFKDIVCNPEKLQKYIIFSMDTDVSMVSRDLCQIKDDMVSTITNDLVKQLNIANLIRVMESFANMTGDFNLGVLMNDVADLVDLSMKTGLADLLNLDGVASAMRQFAGFLPDIMDLGDVDFNRISELYGLVEPMLQGLQIDAGVTDAIGELIKGAASITETNFDAEQMLGQLMSLLNQTSNNTGLESMLKDISLLSNIPMTELYPILTGIMTGNSSILEDMAIGDMMASMDTVMLEMVGESNMNMMLLMGESMMDMVDGQMDYFIDMNGNLEETLINSKEFEPAVQTLVAVVGLEKTTEFMTTVVSTENVYNLMNRETDMQTVCVQALTPLTTGRSYMEVQMLQQGVCNPALTSDIDQVFVNTGYQEFADKMRSSVDEMDKMLQGNVTMTTNMTMAEMYERMNQTMTKLSQNSINIMDALPKMLPKTQIPVDNLDMFYKLGEAYFVEANVFVAVISAGKIMETSTIWSSLGTTVQMVDAVLHAARLLSEDAHEMTKQDSTVGLVVDHLPYVPELLSAIYSHINESEQAGVAPTSGIMTLVCVDMSGDTLSMGASNLRNVLCNTNWTDLILDLALTFDPLKIMANVERQFNHNFDKQIDWFQMLQNVEHMILTFSEIEQSSVMRLVQHVMQNGESMLHSVSMVMDILNQLTIEQLLNNQWMFDIVDVSLTDVPYWNAVKHMILLDAAAGRLLTTYMDQYKAGNFSLVAFISDYSPTLGGHLTNMESATPDLLNIMTQQLMNPYTVSTRLVSTNFSSLCVTKGSVSGLLGIQNVAGATEFEQELCNLNWEPIMEELYRRNDSDPDMKIIISTLEALMSDWETLPPVNLTWSEIIATLTQAAELSTSLTPELFGLNMSLGNLSNALTGLENFDVNMLIASLDPLMSAMAAENDTMISSLLDMQKMYTVLSYHFLVFANIQLEIMTNMTVIDFQTYLNSNELNKIFTVMQNSAELNRFVMENLKVYMQDQNKISQLTTLDYETLCDSSSPVFGQLFIIPAKSSLTLREAQEQICGVNLNITILMEELSTNVIGFSDFVQGLMTYRDSSMVVSYQTLSALVEENINLVTAITMDPPTFISPIPDLNATMVQLEHQIMSLFDMFNENYAQSLMNSSTASLEVQLYQLLTSLTSTSPEADKFLQVGQTYLRVLASMSEQMQAMMLNPATGSVEYPEISKLMPMIQQVPEVITTLLYNMLTDSKQLGKLVEGFMTGAVCTSDPRDLPTVPKSIDLDLGDLVMRVCVLNMTALNEEMMKLSETQLISEMYARLRLDNSTESAANVTEIMMNAQRLMDSLTTTEQVPRFLNEAIWNQTLSALTFIATQNATAEQNMETAQEVIINNLVHLQTAMPGLFNVLSIYVDVLQNMLDKGIALSLDPSKTIEGYPELSKVWTLLLQLPEVYTTLTYTSLYDGEKINLFLELIMQGLDNLCAQDPKDLMTVPPGISFDFSQYFSTSCSINMTALDMENMNLAQIDAISGAWDNVWNTTETTNLTEFMGAIEKLITTRFEPFAQSRLFNDSIWDHSLEMIGQFLMNSSSADGETEDITYLIQEQLRATLMGLQFSVPGMNGMLNVFSLYMEVVQNMVNIGMDSSKTLEGYPEMSKAWGLLQQLPEVFATFTYTTVNDNGKISVFLELIMQGLDNLCVQDPKDLMTVPPGSNFDFSQFFSTFCSINMTALDMEYQDISRTESISEAWGSVWNTTEIANITEFMWSVEKLMTSLSEPSTQSRLFNDSIWLNSLEMVEQFLMNPSSASTQTGSMGDLSALLGGEVMQTIATMDAVLDLFITTWKDLSEKEPVLDLDPTEMIRLLKTLVNVTYLLEDVKETATINQNKLIEVFKNPDMLMNLCKDGSFVQYIIVPGADPALAQSLTAVICEKPQHLAYILKHGTNADDLILKLEDIWFNNSTVVDMTKLQQNIEMAISLMFSNTTADMSQADIGSFLIEFLSAAVTRPFIVSGLESVLNRESFTNEMQTAIIQINVVAELAHRMQVMMASGLENPEDVARFLNMWTDSSEIMDTIQDIAFRAPITFFASFDKTSAAVCNITMLDTMAMYFPTSRPLSEVSATLCGKEGDIWYDALINNNFTFNDINSIIQMFQYISGKMYVRSWKQLPDHLLNLAKSVASLNMSSIEDFVEQLGPNLDANQALLSNNSKQGLTLFQELLDTDGVLDELKEVMGIALAVEKFLYSQLQTATDANHTVTLTEVLPNSEAMSSLLQSLVGPETTSAVMVATLHTQEFIRLVLTNGWNATVCNRTAFMSTFTFPDGIDASQIQTDLCGLPSEQKAQIDALLNQIDASQFLKELQAVVMNRTTSDNVWSDLIHYTELLINQVLSVGDINTSGLDEWLHPIALALESLGDNTSADRETCDMAINTIKQSPMFLDIQPVLNTVTNIVAVSNMVMSVQLDMNSALCHGNFDNLSALVQKLNDDKFPEKLQWIAEKFTGNATDIGFSCETLVTSFNGLTSQLDTAFGLIMNQSEPSLAECVVDTILGSEGLITDISKLLTFGNDMLQVLSDPNLQHFLETVTGSQEIIKMVEEFIQAANQQEQVLKDLEGTLMKNLTTVTEFFEESFNIGEDSLVSLLNLTDAASMDNITSQNLLDGLCTSILTDMLESDNGTAELLASLCGSDQEISGAVTDYLMKFVQLTAQLENDALDPDAFWKNLNADISELFSHIDGLTQLANIFTSLQEFDMNNLVNSEDLLRTMQQILIDSGPDALLQSFNQVLDNFEEPGSTEPIIQDMRTMAEGIFAMQTIKQIFIDNIQLKDLVKDPTVFRDYLTNQVALDPKVADAVVDGSLSLQMLLNSSQRDVTEWVCNSTKLASLLEKPHVEGLDPEFISQQFCSLDKETVTKILDEVLQQLDVGGLVEDIVSNTLMASLRSNNITQEQSKASLKALQLANKDLKEIVQKFDNYTKGIPNAVASLASAQTGAADTATMTALLCGDEIPEVKDEFKIVNSLQSEMTLSEAQQKEMHELPGESCKKMYREIMSSTEGPIIWAFLKPLLLGKILYTPNTPVIQKLIEKVNATFSDIADVVNIAKDWVEGTVVLGDLTDTQTSKIEDLLDNDIVKGMVSQVAGTSAADLEDMLYTFNGTDSSILKGLSNGAGMIMDYMKCLSLDRMVAVETEEQMEIEAEKYNKKNEFMAGIVFEDIGSSSRKRRDVGDSLPPHVSYKIRMDIDNVRQTNRIKDRFWRPRPDDNFALDLRYLRGFMQLQDMIDSAIIIEQTGNTTLPHVSTKQFPYPCHKVDSFVNAFSAYLLPVLMTLAMVAGIAISVNILVYDREYGQEETLRAMGMKAGLNWWSWFLVTFTVMAFVAFLQTIILRYGNIFIYSNMIIIFLYFLDFIFSTLMLVYFVSAFFTRKSLAILATLIVYFISYLPFAVLITMEVEMKFWQKFLACLSSTTAFSFTSQYVARFEEQQTGMQWGNVKDSPIAGDDFSFYWSCMMMLIDGAIYLILGWYIRTVKPGKYGVGAPWYFPVCPSWWGCTSSSDSGSTGRPHDLFSEEVVTDHPVAMSVRGLSKTYGNNHMAVKNLNMNVHCGQVTTLLGHNGAAKTTTMHMLSGILEPTKGTVNVFNRPVKNMKTSIGLCPQHNALFDFMTVKEHMELYSKMKSSSLSAKEDVRQLLREVDLWHCRHSLVRDLSGGMQRRLCVALAFVGGTKVVILDEPTSGVDPSGRRAIWNLILRRKSGTGVLLSTHHLDEADMISDRIAVMHEGRLLCEGSPLFLKQHLANGHRLMVVGDSTPEGSDPSRLLSLLQRYIPGSRLLQIVGSNMTFVLPANDVSNFTNLFKDIEANQQALHIVSFGISDPTLEEVFLKVCSAADNGRTITPDVVKSETDIMPNTTQDGEWKQDIDTNGSGADHSVSLKNRERETGCGLALQQFCALLVKRFHHFRRNWRMFLTMLLLPLLLFLVANGLYIIRPDSTKAPSVLLSTAMFGPDSYVFSKEKSADPLAADILSTFFENPGLGTSCMSGMRLSSQYSCVTPDQSFSYPSNDMTNNRTCKCDDFKYTCKGNLHPVLQRVTPTSEILQDLEDQDIEEYLLKSFTDFVEKRYGGFSFDDENNVMKALVWFNNKGYHALPSFYNAYSNGLLRALLKNKNQGPATKYGITAFNHPFLFNKQQLSAETLLQNAVDAGIAVVILLAFTFIPVGALMYTVTEYVNREKHLQTISGISSFIYWFSTLLWDLFIAIIAVAISYGILAIFQHDSFWDRNNGYAVVCLLLLYCWSTLPLVYCATKLFKTASAAFFTLFCMLIFIGITTMMTMFTLNFFRGDDNSLGDAQEICRYLFLIFPSYSLGGGFIDMITNQVTADIFARFNTDAYIDPFSLDLAGWNMIAMAIEGLVFFIIVILLDIPSSSCQSNGVPPYSEDTYEDADVTMERMRIKNGDCKQDLIIVDNLHKMYVSGGRVIHAVNGLTFGVPGNQCFGLLGVNGAGKTTTFNMLTGAIHPNKGSAMLLGKKLKEGSSNLGHNMGYCPQDEALDLFLSVEEMLYFHAKLKGLHGADRKQAVTKVIQTLQLGVFKHKMVKACSGGMKRKLSLAIALLGDPPLMLLDEPTSGMDPKAKRLVWNCLMNAKSNDQAIILTSHSMEECDNLCDQIGIMVNGEFKCLGSSQHLKQKYGQGYTVTLNTMGLSTSRNQIYDMIQQHFPGASLRDQHRNVIQLDMPRSSMRVSDIYEVLEKQKVAYNIQYYTVTQTTLDTVFLNFTQDQTDNITVDELCSDTSSSLQYSSDPPSVIIPKNGQPSYAFSNSAYSSDKGKDSGPFTQWDKPSTYL